MSPAYKSCRFGYTDPSTIARVAYIAAGRSVAVATGRVEGYLRNRGATAHGYPRPDERPGMFDVRRAAGGQGVPLRRARRGPPD